MDNETMPKRNLAFLLVPAAGNRSFNQVVIAAGAGKLEAGTVLGRITASDKFTAAPAGEVVGKEGAEVATAILGYGVNATDADVDAVVVDRDATVKLPMLSFDASVDDETKTDAKIAQLEAVGIRAR
ncbi:head decoration protein [Pseudooceanicola sp. HF7]|uniref:head decoration protein n=1 Tax=Pseudooceanicola sp. HF7 TaxID=2721560 RepID=UPI00142FA7BF|nr:head decoration protein [Pseudooceanicola sp. HF7]NIZ11080.1 head decoration protein [Pseudooceanicola sp. HF7]